MWERTIVFLIVCGAVWYSLRRLTSPLRGNKPRGCSGCSACSTARTCHDTGAGQSVKNNTMNSKHGKEGEDNSKNRIRRPKADTNGISQQQER